MKRTIFGIVVLLCLLCVIAVIIFGNNEKKAIETLSPSSTVNSIPESEIDNITSKVSEFSNEPSQSPETNQPSAPVQAPENDITLSETPRTPVLVNEQDDEKGLICLGLPYDDLILILEQNGISYQKMEDFNSYVVEFRWNNSDFLILFEAENLVVGIEVGGRKPVQVTSTQKGLNIGDTYDKMVELYGNDYVVVYVEDKQYHVYEYKIGDHYFQVWFQSDVISSWRIIMK